MKIYFGRILLTLICALATLEAKALELDPKTVKLLESSGTTEDGTVYNMDSQSAEVVEYVKSNWRELVESIDKVPNRAETTRGAAMLIGLCAEDLPPGEYLDFLDAYLNAYAKKLVTDDILLLQLCGLARKNDFLSVNWEHPRVQSFLKRAAQIVPEESTDLQILIEKLASGKLSDMYLANKSDSASPPETLPGIKLRRPFDSIFGGPSSPKSWSEERRSNKDVAMSTQSPEASKFPLPVFVGALTALGCGIWFWAKRRKTS